MSTEKLTNAAPLILDMFELTVGMLEIAAEFIPDQQAREGTAKFIRDARVVIEKVKAPDRDSLIKDRAEQDFLETGKRPGE